jgi:hypothetical protein
MWWWCVVAWAADEADSWVGAGLTTGAVTDFETAGAYPTSQIEVNARLASGRWSARLDLDVHFDPLQPEEGPAYPLPPEYAQIQYGETGFRLRGGVNNANFGLQEWDERDNYLPGFSQGWGAQIGQNVGVEPGIVFEDGTEIFTFVGHDLAWGVLAAGAGFATELDAFGSWTGLQVLPDLHYGALFSANEIYPADALWLTLEVDAGMVESTPFVGGQLVANVFPESLGGAAVRLDAQPAPQAVEDALGLDLHPLVASVAGRVTPTDWFHAALQLDLALPDGGGAVQPGALLLVDLHVPEPE